MKIILTPEDKGFIDLSAAVLAVAINDYEKALRKCEREPEKAGEVKALEHFFLSDYGEALSFGHGAAIIDNSKKKVAKGVYQKVKVKKRG